MAGLIAESAEGSSIPSDYPLMLPVTGPGPPWYVQLPGGLPAMTDRSSWRAVDPSRMLPAMRRPWPGPRLISP